MNPLNSRLRNCLATILELEGALQETHLGPVLRKEFEQIKLVMERLENVSVGESDVCRIEAATGRFLAELKDTFGVICTQTSQAERILQ